MNISDAKVILNRILSADITDSILSLYQRSDSLKGKTITLQVEEIKLLQLKSNGQDTLINNLTKILSNDKEEIKIINQSLKEEKKEVHKQKLYKSLALVGDVVLPVITAIVVIKLVK